MFKQIFQKAYSRPQKLLKKLQQNLHIKVLQQFNLTINAVDPAKELPMM